MKVALILTGNLRSYATTYDNLKENIIGSLNPDIFLHTWETQDSITPTWWKNNTVVDAKQTSESELVQMYQPKKILIEPNKNFELKYDVPSKINMPGIYSMFYGWQKGFEIMKEFEVAENIEYDIIIRTRFDIWLNQKITIELLQECIDKNSVCLPLSDTWSYFGGYSDTFIIAPKKLAKQSICLLNKLDEFTSTFNKCDFKFFVPEIFFGESLQKNSQVIPLPQAINLLRIDGSKPSFNSQLLSCKNQLHYSIFFISTLGPIIIKDFNAYKTSITNSILKHSELKPNEAELVAEYLSKPLEALSNIQWMIVRNASKWNITKESGFEKKLFLRILFQKMILKNPSKKRKHFLWLL